MRDSEKQLIGWKGRVTLLCLALLCSCAFAQLADESRLRFDRISLDEGLSNPGVNCFFQDTKGFIWIGTNDGLNRFDGREFRVYRPEGYNFRTGKIFTVLSIVQAENGSFWLGGNLHGFFSFDPESGKFTGEYSFEDGRPNWLASAVITCVEKASDGKLWIGTNWGGLHRFDPSSGEMEHFPFREITPSSTNQGIVLCLHTDPATPDYVLMGSHGMGLVQVDPNSGELHFFKDDPEGSHEVKPPLNINAIWKESPELFWIASGSGLYAFDPIRGRFLTHHVFGAEPGGVGKSVSSVIQDEDGKVWVSSYSEGIARFHPETERFRYHRYDRADSRTLSHNRVEGLFIDRGGMVWAAMGGNGLCVFDPNGDWIYEHQFHEDFSNLTDTIKLNAVLQDRDDPDVVWLGTGDGLIQWSRKTGKRRDIVREPGDPNRKVENWVEGMAYRRQGGLWLGTRGGLCYYDPAGDRIRTFEPPTEASAELQKRRIYALHEDREGRLWIALQRGVRRLDPQSGEFVTFFHDPENINSIGARGLTKIHEDRKGNLWFAHQRNGLSMLSKDEGGVFHRFESEPYTPGIESGLGVYSMHEDIAHGVMWFGTTRGLLRIPIDSREMSWIDSVRAEVVAIEQDEAGALWLRLWDKVLRVSNPYAESPEFVVATGAVEIEGGSFGASSTRLNGGVLLFQSARGILFIDPRRFRLLRSPEVEITDFQILGRESRSFEDHLSGGKIVLSDAQNQIMKFKFAAFNFAAPKNNQFAYRLEGFEDDWRYLKMGQLPEATYTTLDPGDYIFRVRGANSQGIWSEEEVTVSLSILPPWWETWWARTLAVAGLLGLVGLFVKMRLKASHKRAELLEAEAVKRNRLNQKLRVSEERFKSFLANSSEQVWCVEIDPAIPMDIPVREQAEWFLDHAGFSEANNVMAETHGASVEDVLTWKFERVLPRELPTTLPMLEEVARSGFRLENLESNEIAKDGSTRVMLNNIVGIIRDNKVVRVWGTTRDVTAQRQAEEAIREKNKELEVEVGKRRTAQEKLHQLTSRLINTQEHERRHVARELHDDLTQRLAAMAMDARIAERDVGESPQKARDELREIQNDLTEMATSTQELSRQLHPKILEELGLARAVRAECRRFGKRFEITMGVEASTDIQHEFTQEESLCLYRILQEALGNVSKHAKASSVEVSLLESEGEVVLHIKDDGVGFDIEAKKKGGSLGVVSMSERARLCGASFEMNSQPGRGTEIIVSLPTR